VAGYYENIEENEMHPQFNIEEKAAMLDDFILVIGQRLIQHFATQNEDLTLKEMFILEILGRRLSATMTELALQLSVPLTTMTSTVTRMVEKGYLERHRIEEDRRVVVVKLTPEGSVLFEKHRHEYVLSVKRLMGTLNEQEQHKILALIAEVLSVISGK
jgi:DNA-binding MarR family transcriptional regulator